MRRMNNCSYNTDITGCVAQSGAVLKDATTGGRGLQCSFPPQPSSRVPNADSCRSKNANVAGSLTSTITTPSSQVSNSNKKTTSTRKVIVNESLCSTPSCGKNRYAALDDASARSSKKPSPPKAPVAKVVEKEADSSDGFRKVNQKKSTRRQDRTPALVCNDDCVIVTINDTKVVVCKSWVSFCRTKKDEFNCKTKHPRNDPAHPHLATPICQKFLNNECTFGDRCKYPHPPELAPGQVAAAAPKAVAATAVAAGSGAPTTAPGVSKTKTAMCMNHVMHILTGSDDCKYGMRCSYAHNHMEVVAYDFLKKFDDILVAGASKIPLQGVFEEVFAVVSKNYDYINTLRLKDAKPRFACIPEPAPKNFSEILEMWTSGASIARKLNETNTLGLFEGPDSANENIVWALARRVKFCNQDLNCEFQRHTVGKASRITKDDVCTHGPNCKRGVHPSTVDHATGILKLICMDELCGNCTCKITSGLQAIEKRASLSAKLEQLKVERSTLISEKAKSDSIKSINTAIENVANELVNTFRKVHLIRDLGYAPLTAISLGRKVENVMPADSEFSDLPKMTSQQIAERIASDKAFSLRHAKYVKDQESRTKAHALLSAAMRRRKFNQLLKTVKPEDPVHYVFVMTQAYNYMTLDQFVADFKRDRIFAHWYNKSLGCDFPSFERDVRAKMITWESMGVESRVVQTGHDEEGDVYQEFNIPSAKDNYRDFWSWYYGVPITSDPVIVGSAGDIAEDIPALFEDYKSAVPSFRITFSDWIASDSFIAESVKVYRESGINFTSAGRYVKLEVKQTGMTPQEFATHNPTDVADWIKVNKDVSKMSEVIKNCKADSVSFQEFAWNKSMYVDFFLRGWWQQYGGDFDRFSAAVKVEGWRHTKTAGNIQRVSEVIVAKLQAKENQKKKRDEVFAKLTGADLIKHFSGAASSKVEIKPAPKQKITPKPKQAEVEITPSAFAGLDEVNDMDDLDFAPSISSFKTKKVLPLASMMPLGRSQKVHIFREQYTEDRLKKDNVCVRKIWIGPFASKSDASAVLSEIRDFNREHVGRGMHLKVMKLDGVDNSSSDSFCVMYGDSVNGRYEKDDSYAWFGQLIPHLCSTVLSDVMPSQFSSNIDTVQDAIMAFQDKEDAESSQSSADFENEKKDVPAAQQPVASAPVTPAPKAKKDKANVEAILLAKKQARQAEKVAQEERKKAAKQMKVVASAPAAAAPAPKKTSVPRLNNYFNMKEEAVEAAEAY